MSLLTPSEAHAFQKFLTSLDTTDFSASWNMQLDVSHEHMPPAHGREALAQATKDLMSLDADKWRYPLPHQLPPSREPPAVPSVNGYPQSQPNSLSFLYSTRRDRGEGNDNAAAHAQLSNTPAQLPPSRSRTYIPPLHRPVEPSSVSARTRSRTFAFENASSSSSSLSPIDPSSSRSSSSTYDTTPPLASSFKRSSPSDLNLANKRRRRSPVASQQLAGDAPQQPNRAPTLLSPSQKKANHIQSEQKRRANIRRGYEALCEVVPPLREAMLAETMEDEEGSANGKRGGRRRCKGRAATEDGEKIDGRAGPKSEHVVLSKTIDYITELLSERDLLKQRLMVAKSALPLDHPLLHRHPDAPPPLWERKWTGGEGKGGDDEEDDDMES